MPELSGYELTAKIRERYSLSELPILLLTAYHRDGGVETGFQLGANDYVQKPMNALELKSRVHSLTKLKQSVSEQLRTEAAWLQAQIKPHFIINTFNAIIALSRFDLERMDRLVQELSNFIRWSIDFRNTEQLISLKDEVKLVQSYLFIEKERFGERIQVVWEGEESIDITLPPLTLQPLVENAINHGLSQSAERGEIRIRLSEQKDAVNVQVIDNGVGMDEQTIQSLLENKTGRGIGLINTDRRLERIYGEGLKVESEQGKGTIISFRIPK